LSSSFFDVTGFTNPNLSGIIRNHADSPKAKIESFLTTYVPQRPARQWIPSDDDEDAEGDLADEMDGMDVGGDGSDGEGQGEERSKAKYIRVLRKVANRQTAEVVVDLADLRKVSPDGSHCATWHPGRRRCSEIVDTPSGAMIRPSCTTSYATRGAMSPCSARPSTSSCPNLTARRTLRTTYWTSSCSKGGSTTRWSWERGGI
jgi:hypothetical protein